MINDMQPNENIFFDAIEAVCAWYRTNKRDLPWRRDRDPYHIWVSEIMLQQTRVETVKPYYERFLRTLPEVRDLAGCAEDRLLKLWEGLGYYSRVRNMQKAAVQVLEKYGGRLPEDPNELLSLAGIGAYTAGAIASIAFGIPVPAVDGNALRITARVLTDRRDITKQSTKNAMTKSLTAAMQAFFSGKNTPRGFTPGEFNQGIMDLGASVCLPHADPLCGECPLASLCGAHKSHQEAAYPVRAKQKQRRIEEHTVLVIRDVGRVILRKRPERGLLAGMYEFPNLPGFLDEDQAVKAAERLGFFALRIRKLQASKHIFSHVEWHMAGYEILVSSCAAETGENSRNEAEDNIISADFRSLNDRYAVPGAYHTYMAYIKGILAAEEGIRADVPGAGTV